MKTELSYLSQDKITNIHAVIYEPQTEIKAILQIVHGMYEYSERFANLAHEMNKQGILVCINDNLGHGLSIQDEQHRGYFADHDSVNILVADAYELTKKVKEKYPDKPYYLLGNSLGSFIVANYLGKIAEPLNGAILIGTGYVPSISLSLAELLAQITQFYHHGWFYVSPFLEKITTGKFHKRFDANNKNSWLSKDKEVCNSYRNDPHSQFKFTCNGYDTLFKLMKQSFQKKNIAKFNKDIPIMLLSGSDDPVGHFGKDITIIENLLKKENIQTRIKIYNNMRHDLLNETEKIIVINDIYQFISINNFKS